MTGQPAIDDAFFEMRDAVHWFTKHYVRIEPADLMSLSALDPPPGYAQVQEERVISGSKNKHWKIPQWHHFRMYRDGGPPTLAVVLGMRPRVLTPRGEQDWMVPNVSEVIDIMSAIQLIGDPVTWRVWLYEHRQGQGWVCLDPGDESHEAVRRLRAEMVLEALR